MPPAFGQHQSSVRHLTVRAVDFAIIQPKLSQYCVVALKEGRRSMLSARPLAAAITALSLVGGAFFILLFSAVDSQAEDAKVDCEAASDIAVLSSPSAPWKGA